MQITYQPKGVCSRQINLTIEDGILKHCEFIGGCNGNLKGIGALVEGQSVEEVIARLDGITCGARPSSCPDQLAKALKEAVQTATMA